MDYVDFIVRISPGQAGGFDTAVTSPEGSCESTLALPASWRVPEGISLAARSIVFSPSEQDGPTPRELGAQLFRALFHGKARTLLDGTTAVARRANNRGVRIRLAMDLTKAGMSTLAGVPWELMTTDETEPPLVMSTQTVLVRALDVMQPVNRIPFAPPLRILVIVSNPAGTAELDLEAERREIEESWSKLANVKVDFVAPVEGPLLAILSRHQYHVVHYMGHGDIDPQTQRGVLVLRDKAGRATPVNSEQLEVWLKDQKQLRLVVLNACKTATNVVRPAGDPFSSVAAALIEIGVPAVVAMQAAISDEAAITFADFFYQRVVDGLPVEAAVAEARKALWGLSRSEWATPVLFLRSDDGVLFDARDATGAPGAHNATLGSGMTTPASTPVYSPVSTPVHVPAVVALPISSGNVANDAWNADDDRFRVFLATPDELLKATYRQLVSGLEARGILVAAAVPPPHESAQHEAAVQSLVRRADLCVHLVGSSSGEPVEKGNEGATYPLEQLRIGLESAQSQLVLIPEQVDTSRIADRAYAGHLTALMERPRTESRLEFVRCGQRQMLNEIVAKQQRLVEARQATTKARAGAGTVRTAFVDLHSADLQHAEHLISHLGARHITPILMPTGDDTQTEVLSMFESNLARVPLFIVVFGSVTRAWVVNRLAAAAQFVTRHNASTRIGVYVAPPVKGADQLRFPPFYDLAPNMSGFDPASVDALIERAAEAIA